MQQVEELREIGANEQQQADKVVEVLSTLGNQGENVAEIAHDARNMVTALDLYCDLLQEPGVLAAPFAHYSGELRLVAAASRRLVEKLVCMNPEGTPESAECSEMPVNPDLWPVSAKKTKPQQWKNIPAEPIRNLAEDLFANRSLLGALGGPTIALTVDAQGGAVPVRMTSEDLTRILVNLVKNSAEAMSAVGRIHISLWESRGEQNTPWVTLNVEDNGPGLNHKILENLFEPKNSSSPGHDIFASSEWPLPHRGLGLSITRSIVEAAGGTIHAANRDPVGACFQIELPLQMS
ncbi:MAG TPA: sensor histidine kinase [Terracidiphilus sp.]|nr:sensor histidine kinase [Terracidiphilus sp.]